jgi:hypothetical protein
MVPVVSATCYLFRLCRDMNNLFLHPEFALRVLLVKTFQTSTA